MKKFIKGLLLLVIAGALSPLINVNAQSYNDSFDGEHNWISGDYVVKQSGSTKKFQQMNIITRNSDGQFVYCLQPGTMLLDNEPYTGYDTDEYLLSNMTQAQWRRVTLLAYYGYGYGNHTDVHWYSITQFMIWQTVPRGQDIYFTDTLNGNRITKYTSEIAELEKLVSDHYQTPSFSNSNNDMIIGNTISINDTNGVLSNYYVSSSDGLSTSINGNTLNITANAIGNTSITLKKTDARLNIPPIIYHRDDSQDLFSYGSYDPITINLNVKVVGGKVEINKVDVDTNESKPQGEASIKNAIYGIYKADGTKVGSITTDENGNAKSDYLPSLGDFYLREETPSNGYELDSTNYYFTITKDNLNPVVKVYEKVINRNFEFTKVYADSKTGIMTAEPNVTFGFYDIDGNLYKQATTNADGRIKINLPYGKYVVKQLTSTTNYEKAEDFNIEVYESGETIYKVIANAEVTAKLKVIKIDKDTGDIIARGGIKFKIFDIDRNEYVTQTITYPTPQTISIFETSSDGILLTPYALKSGHYRLEEVDQVIDGYLWNDTSVDFEIGENSEFINDNEYGILFEVKFENKEVKGQVDLTKYGKDLIIENGSYHYNKILLSGVVYELYASEDIYSANGILMYKKGTLIATGKSSNNGSLSFKDLYLGKYYLLEKSSTNNNVVDNSKHYFELTYKDQYTAIIINEMELENHLPKGTLDFTKTDLVTGEVISGTKVEIYTENNELVYTGYSDEFGKITITDLFVGKFYIIETEASTGYQITTEKVYFEITEDGEIVKANMTNEQIVEVPNTGISDSKVFNIITIILIIAGAGFIIYDKTKKK